MMNKTTWLTKKMKTYSRQTQEKIAAMSFGKGIEHHERVMQIIKESETENEVLEKLEKLQ